MNEPGSNLLELQDSVNTLLEKGLINISSKLDGINNLEFLSYLAYIGWLTFDEKDGYTFVTPIHFEYLAGLFFNKDYNHLLNDKGEPEDTKGMIKSIDEIIASWKMSNSIRKTFDKKGEEEVKLGLFEANLISNYGTVRGYSWYSPIMDNQYKDLFKPFDTELKNISGFTIEKAFYFLKIIDKVNLEKLKEINKHISNNVTVLKETYQGNLSESDLWLKAQYEIHFKDYIFFSIGDVLAIDETIDISEFQNFVNRFSSVVGEDFNTNYRFPSDQNCFRNKPIIKLQTKYFVQNTTRIAWILREEIESDLKQNNKVWQKYLKHKATYLEDKSLKLFEKILPDSRVYSSLFYEIDGKRCELDGLVIYDNNLLIIEAKSGAFDKTAQRGGIKRLEKVIQDNIEYAFQQANRARQYITKSNNIKFYNERGQVVVDLDKSHFQNTFLINITLDYFAELSVELNRLREINMYKQNEFPWTVSLSDLQIISDFIQFPSQFIHYISFRERLNNSESILYKTKMLYELDLLAYYLSDENSIDNEYIIHDINENVLITNTIFERDNDINTVILDFSKIFNEYYNLMSRGISREPIRKKMNTEFYKMIRQLELYEKPGYTNFVLKLLDMDIEEQDTIIGYIHKLNKMVLKDKKDHNISIPFLKNNFDKIASFGISIEAALSKDRDVVLKNFEKWCIMKRYQNKLDEWIGLVSFVDDNRNLVNNFFLVRDETKFDANLDKALKNIPLKNLDIGRNDPCPCGSGTKYKKCHGK